MTEKLKEELEKNEEEGSEGKKRGMTCRGE